MERKVLTALGLTAVGVVLTSGLHAQEIVDEALQDFPAQTERIEYSNVAALRELQNYSGLRQRYLGARLRLLEGALAKLGVEEDDIDEMVLGWQTAAGASNGGAGLPGGWDLCGLAAGRFEPTEIAALAVARGLRRVPIGDNQAYCLSPRDGGTCLTVLDATRGALGTVKQLSAMLAARDGAGPGLNSNVDLARFVDETKSDAPIWGVAAGPAITDWLRASMLGPVQAEVDWSQRLLGLKTLTYTISVGDRAHLEIKLGCKSQEAATKLEQMLDSLRLLQRVAWQLKNPGLPNPLEDVELDSSGEQIDLRLVTSVSTL